jgi:hypothetical protein
VDGPYLQGPSTHGTGYSRKVNTRLSLWREACRPGGKKLSSLLSPAWFDICEKDHPLQKTREPFIVSQRSHLAPLVLAHVRGVVCLGRKASARGRLLVMDAETGHHSRKNSRQREQKPIITKEEGCSGGSPLQTSTLDPSPALLRDAPTCCKPVVRGGLFGCITPMNREEMHHIGQQHRPLQWCIFFCEGGWLTFGQPAHEASASTEWLARLHVSSGFLYDLPTWNRDHHYTPQQSQYHAQMMRCTRNTGLSKSQQVDRK